MGTELSSSLSRSSSRRSVSFSNVRVREYELCLGDNPSVARGPPVSLDWNYITEELYHLDDYEKYGSLFGRRCTVEMKRPSFERLQLLRDLGYSRGEIGEATQTAQKVRDQRIQTMHRIQRVDALRSIFDKLRFTGMHRRRKQQQQQQHQQQQRESDTSTTATARTSSSSSSSSSPRPGDEDEEKE